MIRLRKYIKPFIATIIVAIGLLFVQAFADLNLPNYMSDIVTIGIQQGGIEHASPDALSVDGYEFISTLATPQQQTELDKAYSLDNSNSLSEYPYALKNDVYVIFSELTDKERNNLDIVFGQAVWTMIEFGRAQGGDGASTELSMEDIDVNALYALTPQLKMLPKEVLEPFQKTSGELSDGMKKQTGIVLSQGFISELGVDMDALQTNYILRVGGFMLLITLIGAIAVILVTFLASRVGAKLSRNLRKDIFNKVGSFSSEEFDHFASSSLITRTTNDVTQIQNLITVGIRILFYAPILAIGGIYMIFSTNVSMVWIIGVAIALLSVGIGIVFTVAVPKFKLTQILVDRLNLVARENLSGLMVVRAFGNQEFEAKRFDKANKNLADTLLFVSRVMITLMPYMMLIMNLTVISIVWFGAQQVDASNLQIGDMMAFMQYAMQVIMGFLMISMVFIILPRASVSANRIADVLETENSIVDPKDPRTFNSNNKGEVVFDNVSFRYKNANEDVLHDISFVAPSGKTTAFIGSTGSGKSTLISLIPRFYDVSEGSVKVSGSDVREVTQHDLREQISYVPQKGMLLSGTVGFNLRYGKPKASQEEVEKAADIAQATDFISQKEERFETHIAQAGANVSGGQKQRLSIARALVKNSPILIFDDSFSALDFKTDQRLREALHKEVTRATILIVAQRVSTIINADQIIVLNDGKIVGKGTHRELLKSCKTYFEIASSQLSAEELAL
jgi:ATP-binding cassette subfamily B multidrug efflux pump